MAKQSFLGKLTKGFIRSAVNQVGRDGGRVISNQIYGDAHSTPIRKSSNVPNTSSVKETPESITIDVGKTEYDAVISKELPLWIVAIFCTCGLASIIAFFKGLHYYRKKCVTYKRYEVEQVPIYDKRYKSGIRGYEEKVGYKYYEIPFSEADPNDVKKQKTSSLFLMIISGIVLLSPAFVSLFNDVISNPILFITLPLFVVYVFTMWKPQIALDFIAGSNIKRRVIATIVCLALYCLAFGVKTYLYPDTQKVQTEEVVNIPANNTNSSNTN